MQVEIGQNLGIKVNYLVVKGQKFGFKVEYCEMIGFSGGNVSVFKKKSNKFGF